jgi:hypothetical protein
MMTRVSVAHRPDITTGADNVFQMVKPLLQATLSDRGS